MSAAIQEWADVLKPGGALAMSFNTHVTKRAQLEALCASAGLTVVETDPLAHWVEQAITRDVVIARKAVHAVPQG